MSQILSVFLLLDTTGRKLAFAAHSSFLMASEAFMFKIQDEQQNPNLLPAPSAGIVGPKAQEDRRDPQNHPYLAWLLSNTCLTDGESVIRA